MLETEIRQVIAQTLLLDADSLSDTTDLRSELGIDSMRSLEVIAALEDRWGVMFAEERFGELVTVRGISAILREMGAGI